MATSSSLATFPETQYPGLVTAFSDAHGSAHPEDIEADLEGEQETLPDLSEDDFTSVPANDNSSNYQPDKAVIPPEWKRTVAGASKGVTDRTEGEYLRYEFIALCYFGSDLLIDWLSNVSASSQRTN